MSPHTSPCCAVALGSRACRLLQDSSKGSGAQRRQRQTRWDRRTLLTPFRQRSFPRPSAQPGAGHAGHWGRKSRHQAGHVLASGACPVRRPGWPFLCSCQHWPACRGARLQPRPSLTEAPGVGGKEGLCDLRVWDRGLGRGGAEAPGVCPPCERRTLQAGCREQRPSDAQILPGLQGNPRAPETDERRPNDCQSPHPSPFICSSPSNPGLPWSPW